MESLSLANANKIHPSKAVVKIKFLAVSHAPQHIAASQSSSDRKHLPSAGFDINGTGKFLADKISRIYSAKQELFRNC
ncbi:hypothetical protein CEXT_447031 [Caerostris extrusa]|uniref:Uncharacterized protein n=1 Tax=Caerostris extrusa TaxID=172846 RepID=A0AAV4X1D7_CAEEX|nr:hypothetical protein CEXT_447031 [Caerostris extrusa]